MTKEEKKRKIKLISLILICEWLKIKKSPPKGIQETFKAAMTLRYWFIELATVASQTHSNHKKGIAIVSQQ